LPIAVLGVSVAGLAVVFRRCKLQGSLTATDADRELVESVLREASDKRDS
jgi:hypothetical protein